MKKLLATLTLERKNLSHRFSSKELPLTLDDLKKKVEVLNKLKDDYLVDLHKALAKKLDKNVTLDVFIKVHEVLSKKASPTTHSSSSAMISKESNAVFFKQTSQSQMIPIKEEVKSKKNTGVVKEEQLDVKKKKVVTSDAKVTTISKSLAIPPAKTTQPATDSQITSTKLKHK